MSERKQFLKTTGLGTTITAQDFIDTYKKMDNLVANEKPYVIDYTPPMIITNPYENFKYSELKSGKELRRERRKKERLLK